MAAHNDRGAVRNPWRERAAFLWRRWGGPLYAKGEPIPGRLEPYVRRTYDWAFDGWGKFVWQEFDLGGRRVGAPQFIVNISQSPNYPGPWYQREFLSIWNQAWFSSLRSASGLYRYGRFLGGAEGDAFLAKARLTKELALAAPDDGRPLPGRHRHRERHRRDRRPEAAPAARLGRGPLVELRPHAPSSTASRRTGSTSST